jgi:hypothetical protein
MCVTDALRAYLKIRADSHMGGEGWGGGETTATWGEMSSLPVGITLRSF